MDELSGLGRRPDLAVIIMALPLAALSRLCAMKVGHTAVLTAMATYRSIRR